MLRYPPDEEIAELKEQSYFAFATVDPAAAFIAFGVLLWVTEITSHLSISSHLYSTPDKDRTPFQDGHRQTQYSHFHL